MEKSGVLDFKMSQVIITDSLLFMKRRLIIILILFALPMSAQDLGWQWQNPYPFGGHYNKMCFINETTGWIVGDGGIIRKTTNGGETWQTQNSYSTLSLTAVRFLTPSLGWIAGGNTILKTSNGGDDWTITVVPGATNLNYLYFTDSNHGFATSYYQSLLFQTSDGGLTWTSQNFNNDLRDISFVNSSIGWIIAENQKIIKTTDGGISWPTSIFTSFQARKLFFLDSMSGWATSSGSNQIWKTEDGGFSWLLQYSSTSTSTFTDIVFISPNWGWAVDVTGNILKTSNGGTTWFSQFQPNNSFNTVQMFSPQIGYILAYSGRILKTTNGINWNSNYHNGTTNDLRVCSFTDSLYGWAAGTDKLVHTSDGGLTWSEIATTGPIVTSLQFLTRKKGWMTSYMSLSAGYISRTTDGGANWIYKSIPIGFPVPSSVFFSDTLNGWASGSYSGWHSGIGPQFPWLMKTTDGGVTWSAPVEFHSQGRLFFINSQTGWGLPYSKTTDGGNTWNNPATIDPSYNLRDIFFIDSLNGWISGFAGLILATTDGGTTWENKPTGTTQDLVSVHFYDKWNGTAVVKAGTIIQTTDGGNSWQQQICPTPIPADYLSSVKFTDSRNGWIVGKGGAIFHTHSGGGITPVSKTIVSEPAWSLYPNPAEETIWLQTNGRILSVVITDAIGNVQRSENPSSNQLDIRTLKAGIYWVKIQTDEGMKVQKLIKK